MKAARKLDELTEFGSERIDEVTARAGEAASRAGAFVQKRMSEMSERAQGFVRDADERLQSLTGRDVESWAAEARSFVRDHPLRAVGLTIGLGYVLGKILSRD